MTRGFFFFKNIIIQRDENIAHRLRNTGAYNIIFQLRRVVRGDRQQPTAGAHTGTHTDTIPWRGGCPLFKINTSRPIVRGFHCHPHGNLSLIFSQFISIILLRHSKQRRCILLLLCVFHCTRHFLPYKRIFCFFHFKL